MFTRGSRQENRTPVPRMKTLCLSHLTNRPGLPVFPGCQLPLGYSRALSIVVTTRLVLGLNQNLRLYARLMLPLTPTKHIQGERRALARALEGLPCSHNITLSRSYSLQRETVIQGPRNQVTATWRLPQSIYSKELLDRIRIQTTSTGLSPAETITLPYPSSVFLLYANYGYCSPYTNPALPRTQLNQYQYRLDLLSGLVLSPLRTTSHIVLEDILLSLQQSCHRQ